MGPDASDLSLVRRVQRGERGAYDLLVLKYQHKVVKLVMRYLRDPADAEDVAQESFLISTGMVKVRLHSARIIMQKQLASRLEGASPGKRWLR